jgi:hypothetical protein
MAIEIRPWKTVASGPDPKAGGAVLDHRQRHALLIRLRRNGRRSRVHELTDVILGRPPAADRIREMLVPPIAHSGAALTADSVRLHVRLR